MRKQGVIAAFFSLEVIESMNECLENLQCQTQCQTDAKLTRSQEVCIKLALTVQ
jgi:hypothetical protein